MYTYSNKINIATNQDKTELVLSFVQESPQFSTITNDGEEKPILQSTLNSEPVANIVVTGSFAREIARLILSVMDQE